MMDIKQVEDIIPILITKTNLIERVENLVRNEEMRYSEACCEVCDQLGVEYEDLAPIIIKTPIKLKLEQEAILNHVIRGKQSNTLLSFM